MTIRTKYQLPVCATLPDIKFDLIELKKEEEILKKILNQNINKM